MVDEAPKEIRLMHWPVGVGWWREVTAPQSTLGVVYIRADAAERELNTMAETLRIAQARCTELLEEVRRLRPKPPLLEELRRLTPKPPLCQCAVGSDGQRYAHGACMAFHNMKAVGFINAEGKLMRGDFAGGEQ